MYGVELRVSVTKPPLDTEMGVGFKDNGALVEVLELCSCEGSNEITRFNCSTPFIYNVCLLHKSSSMFIKF